MKKATKPSEVFDGLGALLTILVVLVFGFGGGAYAGAKYFAKKGISECEKAGNNKCAQVQESKDMCDSALRDKISEYDNLKTVVADSNSLIGEVTTLLNKSEEIYGNYDDSLSQYDLMDAIANFKKDATPFMTSIKKSQQVDFNKQGKN